jgi:branched-chain amino acid transport system substrate-binding protein
VKRLQYGGTIAAVCAALAACGREPATPVRIAIAFPTRNAAVAFMAADEINAAGGLRGAFLQIIRDTIPMDAEPADVEVRRAELLVAQRPLAVVGHGGSRGSLVAAPVYNDAGIVHVVPTGTSRLLRSAGVWTFVLAPDDSVEGAFIARFARERLGARRAALIYLNDEYGTGLRDGIKAALGDVVLTRELRVSRESELAALVDLALRDRPDVLLVAVRAPTVAAVMRLLAARREAVPVIAGDGAVVLPDLAVESGPAAEGRLYAATFWLPGGTDSASLAFEVALRRRLLREPTASDALIYDAVRLLAQAVRDVGREPADVRDWLHSLGRSRPPYRGVTGALAHGARPPLVMGVVRGGTLAAVEP